LKFDCDGLEYEANTFDSSLGHQDIKIVKGGDIETKIVYLVKGHSASAQLQYMELGVWVRALQITIWKSNFIMNWRGRYCLGCKYQQYKIYFCKIIYLFCKLVLTFTIYKFFYTHTAFSKYGIYIMWKYSEPYIL
jgi:hypothetical protein